MDPNRACATPDRQPFPGLPVVRDLGGRAENALAADPTLIARRQLEPPAGVLVVDLHQREYRAALGRNREEMPLGVRRGRRLRPAIRSTLLVQGQVVPGRSRRDCELRDRPVLAAELDAVAPQLQARHIPAVTPPVHGPVAADVLRNGDPQGVLEPRRRPPLIHVTGRLRQPGYGGTHQRLPPAARDLLPRPIAARDRRLEPAFVPLPRRRRL